MSTAAMLLQAALAAFLTSLAFVAAIPSFEGYTSWDSIGNLVPGMSYLEGLGPASTQGDSSHVPFYLSIAATRGESTFHFPPPSPNSEKPNSSLVPPHRQQATQGT